MRKDGWTRGVLVLALVVAMIGILLPDPAHAQKNVTSRFDVTLGGFVQVNVNWVGDEGISGPDGSIGTAVEKGKAEEGRETLRWYAGSTRLFLTVTGPAMWGAKSRAFVEFDFAGDQSNSASSYPPRFRRGFMRWDWPSVYLLLGQDSTVFDGAVSSATEISATTAGRGDRTGGGRSRSPQIQVGTSIPMAGAKLDLAGAIQRNNMENQSTDKFEDAASRAVTPAVTGIAKATVKVFGRNAVFGVSGYLGKETLTSGTSEADVDNTGLALEALVPVGPAIPGIGAFDVRGNWYTAENMHRLSLGFNGMTTSDPTKGPSEIQSDGFWVEGNWEVTKNFRVGLGFGHAEDDAADVAKAIAIDGKTKVEENEAVWLHVTFEDGPFLFQVQLMDAETTRRDKALARSTNDSQQVIFQFVYKF